MPGCFAVSGINKFNIFDDLYQLIDYFQKKNPARAGFSFIKKVLITSCHIPLSSSFHR